MGKWSEVAQKMYEDLQRKKELKEIGIREAEAFSVENHYRIQKYKNLKKNMRRRF